MFLTVPLTNIQDYYSQHIGDRFSMIVNKFETQYKKKPDFIARAPGRVNIIGQHIDYEGYGVLPAAIEKDCLIAVKANDTDFIQICHIKEQQFPSCKLSKFPESISQNIPHSYAKYFAAGYRAGILNLIEKQNVKGLQILIQGNIPVAAGVSSSSALCVCSAQVSNHANKEHCKKIQKQQFVERCIRFQREVGTASGGMDQSISILGKLNSCLHIEFNPVRGEKVNMPKGCKFIIMNSLVESAKLNTAVYRYNKRVCECRLALHIICKNLGVPFEIWKDWKILKQLQDWSKLSLNQFVIVVQKLLPRQKYTKQMISNVLQTQCIDILKDIPLAKEVLEMNEHFALYEAAIHVFNEAYRVNHFINICQSSLSDSAKIKVIGELMNQSQSSCRDLYNCSCPEIDQLTQIAKKNGAFGSRLTGAGWGGCTVSLIKEQYTQKFIQIMKKQYYGKEELKERVQKNGIENVIFATQPCEGAFVIEV